jgi:cell wall-associated NlpC family hydrolase
MHRNIFIIITLICFSPLCTAAENNSAWLNAVDPESPKAISPAPAADGIVFQALALLGIEYKHGGKAPATGFDCSGLVRYVFHEAQGVELPNTSRELSRVGQKIGRDALQPGDLVFYNTLRRGFSHVGIYLGENRFIHAPSTGGEVRIDDMTSEYWARRFNGARRIVDPPPQ